MHGLSVKIIMITLSINLFSLNSLAADNVDPYHKKDDTWISISGNAVKVENDSFILDYGKGLITVEMDGLKWYKIDFGVIEGDRVIVHGKIDNDTFETASIEAGSVYDSKLGQFFYASPGDEEADKSSGYWVLFPEDDIHTDEIVVQGTVTSVRGSKFTIDTGTRSVTVNTTKMPYNPLDDKGYQVIKKGDYVRVRGLLMNYDFMLNPMFYAVTIITIVG